MQAVPDVTRVEDLIRYAVAAQLARLGVPQNAVGRAIPGGPTNLSHGLSGDAPLSGDKLRQLDEVMVALAPGVSHIGGLAPFGVRLRGLHDRTSLTASIPPSWTREMLDAPSDDELHVLMQASVLLASFLAAHRAGRSSRTIRDAYREQIKHVAARLILIGGAPPTPLNIEAQILLGSLAKYAFDITFAEIEDALRYSPLGFRVWRVLTKLLLLSHDDEFLSMSLRPRLRDLFDEVRQLRDRSIYPGRSLDLELAISVPQDWLQPKASVTELLLDRACDPEATLRERGTAAMGLWQRAVEHGRADDAQVRQRLTQLVDQLRQARQDRPDVASGLCWVAATLEQVMVQRVAVCNQWPQVDEPWFHLVLEATSSLDEENLPEHIRPGTKNLFLHVLLQNAGVERRKALDTLIAGGWTEPVTRALGIVLRDAGTDTWLRIRALFALGFLQHRSRGVERSLTTGAKRACRRIMAAAPTRAHITEAHAALFAVGDCYGAKGARAEETATVRDELRPVLSTLIDSGRTDDPSMWSVARAIAYLATFTAQPRTEPGGIDFSERLLTRLREHPDEMTRTFSQWALGFRFGAQGEVRPLLHAAH